MADEATLNVIREVLGYTDAQWETRLRIHQKGSSRNVGTRSLADIPQRLETLGKGESLAGANEWIDQLEQEFCRVKGALPA